tara:strand:+ start:1867 stop:2691 length:825 start_codon:yes stop_codon:yes gene_type:complete
MSFKQNKNPISRKTSPINKDWIAGAIKRPGAFRKKAEAHDMSTKAFAQDVISNKEDYSTRTGKQAELAETLMGMSRHESGHVYGAGEKKSNSTKNNTVVGNYLPGAGTVSLSDDDLKNTTVDMEQPGELSAMKDRRTDKDMRTDRRSPMYDHEIVSDLKESKGGKKSPLNKHDEWQTKIDAAKAAWKKAGKNPSDFYEDPTNADLYKKQEEARKAHKGSPAKFHEPKGAPEGDRVSHKTGRTKKQIIKDKNARSKMPHPSQQDRSLNKKLNKKS